MKEKDLQIDRSCHIVYSKACKKAILERICGHYGKEQTDAVFEKVQHLQLRRDYDAAVSLLERIPPEILQAYSGRPDRSNRRKHDLEI